MDDAVRVRAAAREALGDIEPQRLRDVLFARLETASMAPGVLVVLSATARDPSVHLEPVLQRSAGVQLIYEGLRLTRSLAHCSPWDDTTDTQIDADIDILAADVFVSRGFYLLAQTEAAAAAVETVQAFGRDQTHQMNGDSDDAGADRALEADVFSLAVRAGMTAVGSEPSAALLNYVTTRARSYDERLPPAAVAFADPLGQRLTELSAAADEPVASSVSDR